MMDRRGEPKHPGDIWFVILIACILLGMMLSGCARTHWLVDYSHASDIARGVPFNNDPEESLDFIGTGATIVVGEHIEIDISQGAKRYSQISEWENGTSLHIRTYPRGRD